MKKLILLLLFVSMTSEANNANNTPDPVMSSSNSSSHAVAKSESSSTSNSISKGGDASASGGHGGSAEVGDVSGGASSATVGDVSIRDRRQAPSVTVIPGNTTAECMVAWGIGGSNKTGAVSLGPTWMQKDCYAMKTFKLLADMGMPEAASKAFCSRKLHWFPFESKENCQAMITQSLIAIEVDRSEVAEVKKRIPSHSPLQSWLKETEKRGNY